ncbi:hypothetical protein [Petrocella sp. FN5]|uniref:hypothetical protein n=1 Tax=Petrocella sp. FN5 TaxID=3032002 RepID=UPI0023DA2811|nr:hypothetical protein [Petrocella sp. FN5]MDF1617904.1 hypothetical protein [Petrocella sp. FN5]
MTWKDVVVPILFVIVLGGMALLLTRRGRQNHEARAKAAAQKNYQYNAATSVVVNKDVPRNLLYTLRDNSSNESSWKMEAYFRKNVKVGSSTTNNIVLYENTKWLGNGGGFNGLIIPKSPIDLSVEEIAKSLETMGHKMNIRGLQRIALPERLSKYFDMFSDDERQMTDFVQKNEESFFLVADNYPIRRHLVIMITPDNISMNVSWCIENPEDMMAFAELGASLLILI